MLPPPFENPARGSRKMGAVPRSFPLIVLEVTEPPRLSSMMLIPTGFGMIGFRSEFPATVFPAKRPLGNGTWSQWNPLL
jgi:hypothetical protein